MIAGQGDIAWGDVPTWIAGGVALLTLIAAVIAATQAGKVYRLESARDQLAESDRRLKDAEDDRRQATGVSAWLDASSTRRAPAVLVRNSSDLPVYECVLRRMAGSSAVVVESLAVVPPTGVPIELPIVEQLEATDRRAAIEIAFTDAAGVRWRRDFSGSLRRVSSA